MPHSDETKKVIFRANFFRPPSKVPSRTPVYCSTARSRAFTLYISLTFSAAADHANGLHSRLDHCMHSERMHKL